MTKKNRKTEEYYEPTTETEEDSKTDIKSMTLKILLPMLAILILLAVVSGDLISGYNWLGLAISQPVNQQASSPPTDANPPGDTGLKCASGSDCFPRACHNGVCTENCYSHDECGGPGTRGYFCNYDNKCAYVGEPNYRMLCSKKICCANCEVYAPICGSGTDSTCVSDEFSTDGSAYCAQSPFCITGPNHEENINGAGNLLFGNAILPNYVKCDKNTAYRCIGFEQTQDPDYKNNDNLWSVTKCKSGEKCVEGLADQGGGCTPT